MKENDVMPCASVPDESAERTRVSLLEKVRDPENKSAWDRFYRRYSPLKGLYQQSAWYKFQESVKRYAELAETVLAIPLGLARQAME